MIKSGIIAILIYEVRRTDIFEIILNRLRQIFIPEKLMNYSCNNNAKVPALI